VQKYKEDKLAYAHLVIDIPVRILYWFSLCPTAGQLDSSAKDSKWRWTYYSEQRREICNCSVTSDLQNGRQQETERISVWHNRRHHQKRQIMQRMIDDIVN